MDMDSKNLVANKSLPVSMPANLMFLLFMSVCFLLLSYSLVSSLIKKNSPYAYLSEPPMHPAIGGLGHDAAVSLAAYPPGLEKSIQDSRSETFKRKKLLSMLKSLDKPALLDFELKPYTGYKAHRYTASLSGITVVKGRVSSHFGMRRDPFNGRSRFHRGVDIAARRGTKVFSPASGFVMFAGRKGGYGNVVEIQHDQSTVTRYAHLQGTLVSQGQVVHKGDVVGLTGSTGRSTGPHLHLEVLKNGRQVDPERYFDGLLAAHKK
jgi:murein DD-endopeptidase MepM/ murein hydrolase activator NlpD